MKNDKILSLLGLATKSGRVVSGEFMVEKLVKARNAKLVIVATDASDTSKKSYNDMCSFYHVPIYFYGTKESLGHSIGKEMRASVAVMDEGFAKSIEKKLKDSTMNTEVIK